MVNQVKELNRDLARSHGEISRWVSTCEALVLPSLNEGNPTDVFECPAIGKPFIGSRVGGMPRVMVNDDYGFFLCEPSDPCSLVERILIGLEGKWVPSGIRKYSEHFIWRFNHFGLSSKLGRAPRRTIMDGDTCEERCKQYVHIYRKVMQIG